MSVDPRHDDRDEVAHLLALASVPGIGPTTLRTCQLEVGARAAWEALCARRATTIPAFAKAAERLGRQGGVAVGLATMAAAAEVRDPIAMLERHESRGIVVVAHGGPGYPARLVDDPEPPALLFLSGHVASLDAPTVAIVGTRNATRLGCDTAAGLAADLARLGVAVVSGLALGIDGAAHRAVTSLGAGDGGPAPGRPVGVVATGLDLSYPRRHQALQAAVAQRGLLVSEAPLGTPAAAWRFPARNRIIAGLADAVVVVESRSVGGSMLTASEAMGRNAAVLAVPGHPTSPGAAGPLDLISEGALPLRDVEDVLVAIGLGGRSKEVRSPSLVAPAASGLSTAATSVLACIEGEPLTLGSIVVRAALELDQVATALLELEEAGAVVRSGSWYERTGSKGS